MLETLLTAEKIGIRLEIVQGLPIWEPQPVWRHQKAVDRIRSSIKKCSEENSLNHCQCVHAADV